MNRDLSGVTTNSRKRLAPKVNQRGNQRQLPADVGSDKPPKGATNVRGGKHNKGTSFGRGDGKERDYPTQGPSI